MTSTDDELEARLRYVTWQRDCLADALRAISDKWHYAQNAEYRSKGDAIADLVLMVMGGHDD